jgi:hypothetical protein
MKRPNKIEEARQTLLTGRLAAIALGLAWLVALMLLKRYSAA